jgi:hypothetical protein
VDTGAWSRPASRAGGDRRKRIADTASAHNRVFIVEVMGRYCGYLAMASAVAAGADIVLFPEADRTEEELVTAVVDSVLAVRARDDGHKVIAIKAERIDTPTDRLKDLVDSQLARRSDIPPTEIETRVTVLGHVVRGGRAPGCRARRHAGVAGGPECARPLALDDLRRPPGRDPALSQRGRPGPVDPAGLQGHGSARSDGQYPPGC